MLPQKVDCSGWKLTCNGTWQSLSPDEQRLLRLYGKMPTKKDLLQNKLKVRCASQPRIVSHLSNLHFRNASTLIRETTLSAKPAKLQTSVSQISVLAILSRKISRIWLPPLLVPITRPQEMGVPLALKDSRSQAASVAILALSDSAVAPSRKQVSYTGAPVWMTPKPPKRKPKMKKNLVSVRHLPETAFQFVGNRFSTRTSSVIQYMLISVRRL